MSTKGPVHLIDFDGVLVRNTFLDRLVREKATRFLQHQLQCSPETAAFLNTTLTPLVGHTTLVLGTAPPPKKLVQRYNRFVYDAHTMFSVKPCVEICEPRDRRRVRRLTPGGGRPGTSAVHFLRTVGVRNARPRVQSHDEQVFHLNFDLTLLLFSDVTC